MKRKYYYFSISDERFMSDDKNIIVFFDIETIDRYKQDDINDYENLNVSKAKVYEYTYAIHEKYYKGFYNYKDCFNYVYINKHNKNGLDLEEFLNELQKIAIKNRKKKIYLIGFNSLKFDALFLRKYVNKIEVIENKKAIKYEYQNIKIYCYDLLNMSKALGFTNLKSLGNYLSLEKLDIKDKNYNIRDVEILVTFFYFLKQNEVNTYSAQNASRNLLYLYMKKHGIESIHTDIKVDKLDYIGGRVENYIFEAENVFYLDINSLYPYVMTKTFHMPWGEEVLKDNKKKIYINLYPESILKFENYVSELIYLTKFEDIVNYVNKHDYFYIVKFKIKSLANINDFYFAYSFVDKDKRRYFKPELNKEYWSYAYENYFLVDILENIEILEVYKVKKKEFFLSETIENLYRQRIEYKKNKDEREKSLKLILNSLYGIFAVKSKHEYEFIKENQILNAVKKYFSDKEYYLLDYNEEYKVKEKDKYFILRKTDGKYITKSIPIFSIFITSHARFVMFYYIRLLTNLFNKSVFYTDTDSLFIDENAFMFLKQNNLIHDYELGKFKFEGKFSKAYFYAPKIYSLHEDNKILMKVKGINLSKLNENYRMQYVMQSILTDYKLIEKDIFNMDKLQKRVLKDNYFVNNPGKLDEKIINKLKEVLTFLKK